MVLSVGVSGGHINPALTVALAAVGKVSWRKVPHYLLAQYLGAIIGAALVFFVYWDGLVYFEHQQGLYRDIPGTASIFSTFPAGHLSLVGGAGDQVLATALLAISVCSGNTLAVSLVNPQLPAVAEVRRLGPGGTARYSCPS